ncbi:hypothetical protein L9F63_004836 [Diploptera punctata]|uniref:Uncharacterized protein n=1 Tax=Diploptera punctata TaxID=6984 RepID=A0AAD7ZFS8_DIPPU|nr:hypothetical protein L9F63_004836 [Diploptera punctata]
MIHKHVLLFLRFTSLLGLLWGRAIVISGNSILYQNEEFNTLHAQQLSKCIIRIIETHFNRDMTLTIQSPESWHSVYQNVPNIRTTFTQVLFEMINSHNLISYVSLGYIEDYRKQIHNTMKPGSHILILSGADGLEIKMAISMLERIRHDLRNDKAKLLIVYLEPVNTEKQFQYAGSFLLLSWRAAFLADASVLLLEKFPQNKREEIVYYFKGFRWLPEDQKDLCSMLINKIHMNAVWTSKDNRFYKKDIFPSKRLTNMKNCSLIINAHQMYPYLHYEGSEFRGIMFKYFEIVQNLLNTRFKYIQEENTGGIHVPIVYDANYEECSFTYPYIRTQLTWFVPSGEPIPRWQSLIKVFNADMWIFICVTFISGTLIFWWIAILSNISKECRLETGISLYCMNSLQNHLAMGIRHETEGPLKAIFLTLWLFYCLQIYTLYQSSLIGFVINPGELPPVKNVKELEESDLKKLSAVSFSGDSFKDTNISYYVYPLCKELRICYKNLAISRNSAVLDHRYHGLIFIRMYHSTEGKPSIVPLVENLDTLYTTMYVRRVGCMLHARLETILRQLVNSGIMNKWIENFDNTFSKQYYANLNIKHTVSLKMLHVQGAYYLMIIGLLLATLLFILELLCYIVKNKC